MRMMFTGWLFLLCMHAAAGFYKTDSLPYKQTNKYLSFNPLALAEPQMAIGVGYGFRWTNRSELFTELSLLTDNLFYKKFDNNLEGFRLITQYRYYFRHPLMPFSLLRRGIQSDESYITLEARLKNYQFSGTKNFINPQRNDTLGAYSYRASATVYGGAILLGDVYDLSRNSRLKLEVSAGIGVKQKVVKMTNLPAGYRLLEGEIKEWGFVPRIYEPHGFLYLPFAIRLRFKI